MQQITIITTYYNEPDLLKKMVDNYLLLKKVYDLKLIVVDDGSITYPAINYIKNNLPDFMLLRVINDLGFNSHGARNLGMLHSTTEWNFLTDIDNDISSINYEKIFTLPFNNKDVYSLHVNSIILTQDTFWSCKGYDEEFVGLHYGDRFFLNYLNDNFDVYEIKNTSLKKYRNGWEVVFIDGLQKDYYRNGKLYMKPLDNDKNKQITSLLKNRYFYKDFTNKNIINFEWELLIYT